MTATGRFGAGYRAALADIMDALEGGGLDRAVEWIENNADSKAYDLTERAKAYRKGQDRWPTMNGFAEGYAAGAHAERAETEASLDDLRKAGFRLVKIGDAE